MDKDLIGKDPHFKKSCSSCHGGNEAGGDKARSHQGFVKRPSEDLKICGSCHAKTAATYGKALHYTAMGHKTGVGGRFSAAEMKQFAGQVFEKSCRSCHASCGDCHVQKPSIGGINLGLIEGHKFVRKDEGKTCALCHGGRVYPEFTGDYEGSADVHYQKGMLCMDCHKKEQMHGDGTQYLTKEDVKSRPRCVTCHSKLGNEANPMTKTAHTKHEGKVSCYGCHSGGNYRQCYNCHLGTGATSKPGFYLGLNPRDKKTVTTLRLIPTVRDTFEKAGIKMSKFDDVSNYWNSPVHNIKKRTDRTRSCNYCHAEKKGFLTPDMLIKDGSKANNALIYSPKPINR